MLILDKQKAIERMLVAASAAGSAVPEGSGQWFGSVPARRLARLEPRRASAISQRQAERRAGDARVPSGAGERRTWPAYPASVEMPPFPVF